MMRVLSMHVDYYPHLSALFQEARLSMFHLPLMHRADERLFNTGASEFTEGMGILASVK